MNYEVFQSDWWRQAPFHVWAPGMVFSNTFRYFFAWLWVVSSHTCLSDQYFTEDSIDTFSRSPELFPLGSFLFSGTLPWELCLLFFPGLSSILIQGGCQVLPRFPHSEQDPINFPQAPSWGNCRTQCTFLFSGITVLWSWCLMFTQRYNTGSGDWGGAL